MNGAQLICHRSPNGIAGEDADQAQAAVINLNSLSNFPPASAATPAGRFQVLTRALSYSILLNLLSC
jgi:hypothetical protein